MDELKKPQEAMLSKLYGKYENREMPTSLKAEIILAGCEGLVKVAGVIHAYCDKLARERDNNIRCRAKFLTIISLPWLMRPLGRERGESHGSRNYRQEGCVCGRSRQEGQLSFRRSFPGSAMA